MDKRLALCVCASVFTASTRSVSGLAQIHGRDLVSPADKVHWDVKYLKNFGMWEDVKILFVTIPAIFGGEGVVKETERTIG